MWEFVQGQEMATSLVPFNREEVELKHMDSGTYVITTNGGTVQDMSVRHMSKSIRTGTPCTSTVGHM